MLTQTRQKWLSRGGMLVVAALVLGTTQAPAAGLLVADGGFGGVEQHLDIGPGQALDAEEVPVREGRGRRRRHDEARV